MTKSLDQYLSGRYQACAVNYNDYLKKLFGKRKGLDRFLAFSIQFTEISDEQLLGPNPQSTIPERLRAYIVEFDGGLEHEEYNSPKFSYRLLFKKKMVNRPGQADRVVEFIDPNSDLAKAIDREYWVKKEVERRKYRATDVVTEVQDAGFKRFRVQREHIDFWKADGAKDPAKGFGVEVAGVWYWYEPWVKRCLELCAAAGAKYR